MTPAIGYGSSRTLLVPDARRARHDAAAAAPNTSRFATTTGRAGRSSPYATQSRALGCEVECARNGQEALAALERAGFALVLSDVRMLSMNGVEFLEWLTGHRPELLPKIMTGDGRLSQLNAAIEQAGQPMLRKPFTLEALLRMATDILPSPS